MQRITDALRAGYGYAVVEEVPLPKATRVIEKLQDRFPALTRDRRYASRQRQSDQPTYKLVAFINRSAGHALLILLSTNNSDTSERWQNVQHRRVRIYQYEAVRATKEGQASPAWTWQITADELKRYKSELRELIRAKRSIGVQAFADASARWPGFAGVRKQREAIKRAIEGEWARSAPAGSTPPHWPRLRYVQRLPTR